MQTQEHVPDIGVAIRKRRPGQLRRRVPQRAGGLKEMRTAGDSMTVRDRQSGRVFRVCFQSGFDGTKKSVTRPRPISI